MSQEFSTILYYALSACFGLQPSSSEASVLLREAYQDPENAPRPPRNTDVIWYSAAPDPAAGEAPPAYAAELSATSIVATPYNGDGPFRLTSPSTNNPPLAVVEGSPVQASHVPAVSSFSAWTLTVVCYGPHALENARKIRAFLFLDGAGFPRAVLRKAGLYPVPDPPEPMLLHEPEGSLWRQRADLTVSLRAEETQTHPARRNAVTAAPAIQIHRERG